MAALSPSPSARFRRNDDVSMALVDDLAVILNVESGSYHGFNTVGSHIWELLQEPRSTAEIVADLTQRFEVEASEAEQATTAFLTDLAESGLVEQVEG